MSPATLYEYQLDAVKKMKNGCILCGNVGSGKSRTALGYYYILHGGAVNTANYVKMTEPKDLFIITTARKRDTHEWDRELALYMLNPDPELNLYTNRVVVDSWNNIGKYRDVKDGFFIFDEQRVVGNGVWVQSFLKIAKSNLWILLSATPGDTWEDYIPVFLANGFYRYRSEFLRSHVIFSRFTNYPKVDRYINVQQLIDFRDDILVTMDYLPRTEPHHEWVIVDYDTAKYRELGKKRWNPYENKPIQNAGELCYLWRKVVNEDQSRQVKTLELAESHPKLIIFYNFDYELQILKGIGYPPGTEVAEWNGHNHNPLPNSDRWVYLVQYTAGCEGWNCIKTDTIVFFSQNYSYKVMAQAAGRIDRLNTPYTDLYYYHLRTNAPIDVAIARSLRAKKTFNESRFVKW